MSPTSRQSRSPCGSADVSLAPPCGREPPPGDQVAALVGGTRCRAWSFRPGQAVALLGRAQGPVIANTYPGDWMFANSTLPSALKAGPVNSLSLSSLRASG